ncbi:MAG: LPXTG cell wall anchor domain-containing protein [Clostridia bacterium]|nr:LPXTG cell wall anchor domain-containing protein [Clostridia bacterium]
MKHKWAVLLLAVALLGCSCALAEAMTPVPYWRIEKVMLPEGIVIIGQPVITDGRVTVRVDDEATNWTEVLLKAAARDGMAVTLSVTAPDASCRKATREDFGSFDGETLEGIARGEVPGWFAGCTPDSPVDGSVDGSAMFAEVRFGQPTYLEFASVSGAGTLICWQSDDGRKYEYVQWDIIHSSSENVREVSLPALSVDTLSSVPSALPGGVTAEIETGGITCVAKDFSAFSSLPIVLNAPSGAQQAIVYSQQGQQTLDVRNGKVELSITPDSHSTFRGAIAPAQLDYTVVFAGEVEPELEVYDCGLVSVWLLASEKAPYPYYNKAGVQPVAAERLSIYQGGQPVNIDGIYRQQYGQAHLSRQGLDVTANPSGVIRMEVAAPAWAVAYGICGSGGDFIYQTNWQGLDVSTDKNSIAPGSPVSVYNQPLFKTVQAGRALVYLQEGITARYGGYVQVISWYDDAQATQPRLVEYIAITHESFSQEVRNPVCDTENFSQPVTEVTGVSGQEWQLVVRYDPQQGERAIHYDLHMEDERNVTYQLDGATVFYLPYPEGCSYMDTQITYQLYHYDEAYQSYVSVRLEPTPFGLRFVEDHLSPFVLMWDSQLPLPSEIPEADLPQTGDDMPLAALMGLLLVSLAVLAAVARRKRGA